MSNDDRKKIVKEINNKNRELNLIRKNFKNINLSHIPEITNLSNYEFSIALHYVARKVDPSFSLSKSGCLEIKKLLISKKPNIQIKIKSIYLLKEYDFFKFVIAVDELCFSYVLKKPGKLNNKYFYLDFTNGAKNRNVKENDYPLIIRNARKDDLIRIKDYYKSFRRLCIDWKMPQSLRKRWPVIVNKDNKIIYIPRYQKNFVSDNKVNFVVNTKNWY